MFGGPTCVAGPAPAHSPGEAMPSRVILALGAPMLIVFLFFQSYFVRGLAGATKG